MARDVLITTRITQEQSDALVELGDGNRSAGLQILLDEWMNSPAPPTQDARTVRGTTSPRPRVVEVVTRTTRYVGKR